MAEDTIPRQEDLPTYKECPDCGEDAVKQGSLFMAGRLPEVRKFRWWCLCGYRGEKEEYVSPGDDGWAKSEWMQRNRGTF